MTSGKFKDFLTSSPPCNRGRLIDTLWIIIIKPRKQKNNMHFSVTGGGGEGGGRRSENVEIFVLSFLSRLCLNIGEMKLNLHFKKK